MDMKPDHVESVVNVLPRFAMSRNSRICAQGGLRVLGIGDDSRERWTRVRLRSRRPLAVLKSSVVRVRVCG